MESLYYATSKDWLDIMKNRSKLRMHELIERLGLRAKWSQNKRGKTNFESALVRDLVTDMSDVVATLPKESDELVKFLSEERSLGEQVEGLLQKHGAAIWGRVGDREHLISVGEPGVEDGVYPRDLYFENEEDRELIRRLLHWWLGMKAINVILARERLERERKKKEENKRARVDGEPLQDAAPSTFVALAPNAGGTPLHINTPPVPGADSRYLQNYQIENTSRGSPISIAVITPPELSESPVVPAQGSIGNGEASHILTIDTNSGQAMQTASIIDGAQDQLATDGLSGPQQGDNNPQRATNPPSWATVHAVPQPVGPRKFSVAMDMTNHMLPLSTYSVSSSSSAIRQLGVDISKLVSDLTPEYTVVNGYTTSSTTPQTAQEHSLRNDGPYRGLDIETLSALRAYIYHEETSVSWDEDELLRRLETAWREGVRSDHNCMLDDIPIFIARERAILTWFELKRHLADLDRADKRWREEGSSAPEIERRIQQHRTLMSATRELLRSYDDIAQVTGPETDIDELLRQAFEVLAGEKYAVELQWNNVEFIGVMRWLAEHLEAYLQEQEEEGDGVYFVG